MADQYVFRRREVKYLLTLEQLDVVRAAMEGRMRPDEHGRSTLCNVYLDTPDHLLIRRSLEHPLYKEKLRVRSYGVAGPDSAAFVEIKKKYRRTVYKRRIGATEAQVEAYLAGEAPLPGGQIAREVDFFMERYRDLAPSVQLSYEREAFYGIDDREFRMTFDDAILWRDYDLSLRAGVYGEPLLPKGRVLMEVKAGGAYPLWVSELLSAQGLFPAHFSKYGRAWQTMQARHDEFALPAGAARETPRRAPTRTRFASPAPAGPPSSARPAAAAPMRPAATVRTASLPEGMCA